MRRHGETDGAAESAGKARGRAPRPGDSPPFSRTGAGTGAPEPRLPRRGGQSPGRGRGLQPREP